MISLMDVFFLAVVRNIMLLVEMHNMHCKDSSCFYYYILTTQKPKDRSLYLDIVMVAMLS